MLRNHLRNRVLPLLAHSYIFDLNKLHYALHYRIMIERFGTTDNYNTEHTERLHIPYAKDAYGATNGKDEYSQMTVWVERKEKIFKHEKYLSWYFSDEPSVTSVTQFEAPPTLKMTKHPSRKSVPFDTIE